MSARPKTFVTEGAAMMRRVCRRSLTVALVATLYVHGCDWFEDQARVNLPPDTEITQCPSQSEILEGSDVELAWSGNDIDGEVAWFEWKYDDSVPQSTTENTLFIEGIEDGDHVFSVRSVDDEGELDPTPAVCAFAVIDTGSLVDRTALVEVFTTNICRNCDKAEAALDSMVAEFGSGRVAVVGYHDVPASDGLATEKTAARVDWYTSRPDFPGEEDVWPMAVFDGLRVVEGAGTVAEARASYRFELNSRLRSKSPLRLRVDGNIGAATGEVAVTVKAEGLVRQNDLVLRIAVIEDDVLYNGYFADIFDFVARDVLAEEPVSLAGAGDSLVVERAFAVDPSWKPGNMDVVAFVQSTATREVLQAASLRR